MALSRRALGRLSDGCARMLPIAQRARKQVPRDIEEALTAVRLKAAAIQELGGAKSVQRMRSHSNCSKVHCFLIVHVMIAECAAHLRRGLAGGPALLATSTTSSRFVLGST